MICTTFSCINFTVAALIMQLLLSSPTNSLPWSVLQFFSPPPHPSAHFLHNESCNRPPYLHPVVPPVQHFLFHYMGDTRTWWFAITNHFVLFICRWLAFKIICCLFNPMQWDAQRIEQPQPQQWEERLVYVPRVLERKMYALYCGVAISWIET